ncbi:MAG: hypothetical protein F6J96_03245 [Symploca sp. SIO1C2]|nr:hypothetical protein [Symploca sp. SIO1C2]
MMTSEEIDYSNLSEEVLKQLALSEDAFIATEALGELSMRSSNTIIPVAKEILSHSNSDIYLKSSALETLFDLDYPYAVNYILHKVADCESYMLNSAMELLIEAELDLKSDSVQKIVSIILNRIQKTGDKVHFPSAEVKFKFQDKFQARSPLIPAKQIF